MGGCPQTPVSNGRGYPLPIPHPHSIGEAPRRLYTSTCPLPKNPNPGSARDTINSVMQLVTRKRIVGLCADTVYDYMYVAHKKIVENLIRFKLHLKRDKSRETRSSAVAVIADRTACSILTLFIVSTTSRPLSKKNPFAVSLRIQLTITADLRPQIRSPHTSLHVHCSRQSRHTPRSTVVVCEN